MTDEPRRDEGFDALLDELEGAGYVERYTNEDGQEAMRLTDSGEQVARQLAKLAEGGQEELMALLEARDAEENPMHVGVGSVDGT